MNRTTKLKPLALSRETVRTLDKITLSEVRGGVSFTCTLFNTCRCPSYSCDTQCAE
jgi:hypothetical protein